MRPKRDGGITAQGPAVRRREGFRAQAGGSRGKRRRASQQAPASLVAPPRTISDVAAILDQQKPDAGKVAELTATADAPVPDGLKGLALGEFYYKRAQARSLLGRSDEALADAELAVSNGQGSDYKNVLSRYEQFLMRRLRDAGQHKRANAMLSKQMATFANQGKGRLSGSTSRRWPD